MQEQKFISEAFITNKFTSYILWLGCVLIVSACISTFNDRASMALNKVKSFVGTLPVVSDSTLIKKEERIVRSNTAKCARVQVLQLYGTNAMTFPDVVDYFESHVDQITWHVERVDKRGASFVGNDSINLGVSDTVTWPSELTEGVQSEMEKYKTLFIISLGSFVEPNITVKQCT